MTDRRRRKESGLVSKGSMLTVSQTGFVRHQGWDLGGRDGQHAPGL